MPESSAVSEGDRTGFGDCRNEADGEKRSISDDCEVSNFLQFRRHVLTDMCLSISRKYQTPDDSSRPGLIQAAPYPQMCYQLLFT